jgi:ABC-2 type transport system permease protein
MIRPLLVALKEVRVYLQDKGDLGFSLLLPIITFALIFGAFGGQSVFHGTIRVVNEDAGGTYSALLLEQLDGLDNLDVELLSRSEADLKLERSDLLMVLFIPEGFSSKLTSGEPTQLLFKQRGNGGNEGQIVSSIVDGVVEEMNRDFRVQSQVSQAVAGKDIPQERIETAVQKYLDRDEEHPLVAVREEAVGVEFDPVNQFLPGIVTMYVLFAITLTARAIVEERKKGTLERLLTTRLTVGQLFAGKFLASILRGLLQTFILLVLSYIVFQLFTPLSFIECLVVAIIFAAAGSALGMLIASVARSEDAAVWIAVVFTMAMVMVSGTFFEIPEGSVIETMSRISVNTYANTAFKTIIVEGGSLADVGYELGILAGVALVALGISRVLFRVLPGGK